MGKEWIADLAQDVKQKNHEAAERYGRDQHYAGIIASMGKEFFMAVTLDLQENVEVFRRQLQGDSTSAETSVQTIKPDEVRVMRARFPWVDARLIHNGETITLEFAKDAGAGGDPAFDRKTQTFVFRVGTDDSLFVEDAFADPARQYRQPEQLARLITEVLLSV